MKSIIFSVLMVILVSCNETTNVELNPFAGRWKWLETKDVDMNGNLTLQDSISAGYSLELEFLESEMERRLKTYKNRIEDTNYIYVFTNSTNQMTRSLSLDKMANALPDLYYWEIIVRNNETHLYLRNKDFFNDQCCLEKIEQHFILKARIPNEVD